MTIPPRKALTLALRLAKRNESKLHMVCEEEIPMLAEFIEEFRDVTAVNRPGAAADCAVKPGVAAANRGCPGTWPSIRTPSPGTDPTR